MIGITHRPLTKYQPPSVSLQLRTTRRPAAIPRLRSLFRLWRQRARERHELARLDQRDLRDIGLSRLEVYDEISKPFWRD